MSVIEEKVESINMTPHKECFTQEDLRTSWERKKKKCVERMVPFNLTLEEYTLLYNLRKNVTCGYSNIKFVTNKTTEHQYYPQLDRICQYRGYEFGNVVWVTNEAHKWKTDFCENEKSMKGLPERVIGFVHRIKKILLHQDNIDTMLNLYSVAYQNYFGYHWTDKDNGMSINPSENVSNKTCTKLEQCITEDEKTSVQAIHEQFEHNTQNMETQDIEGKELMTTNNVYIPSNPEISTARKYAEFGEFIEKVCGNEFVLTYAEFSRKVGRKTCSLTGRRVETQGYFISDKTVGVSKDTFFVVEKNVGEQLDTLMSSCKLSFKDVKTMWKNLNKM